MISIPTSISTKIAGGAALGVVVILGATGVWLNATIDGLRAEKAEAVAQRAKTELDLVVQRGITERLQRELRAQTAQVSAWKAEAAWRQEEAAKAVAAAASSRAAAERRAGAITTLKLPGDEYDALRLLIDTDRSMRLPINAGPR